MIKKRDRTIKPREQSTKESSTAALNTGPRPGGTPGQGEGKATAPHSWKALPCLRSRGTAQTPDPTATSVSPLQKLLTGYTNTSFPPCSTCSWHFKGHITPHLIAQQAPQCWTAGMRRCHSLLCTPKHRVPGKSCGVTPTLQCGSHQPLEHNSQTATAHEHTLQDAEQELIRWLFI